MILNDLVEFVSAIFVFFAVSAEAPFDGISAVRPFARAHTYRRKCRDVYATQGISFKVWGEVAASSRFPTASMCSCACLGQCVLKMTTLIGYHTTAGLSRGKCLNAIRGKDGENQSVNQREKSAAPNSRSAVPARLQCGRHPRSFDSSGS